MKNLEEYHGYKTLKQIYRDTISEESYEKGEVTNEEQVDSANNKSLDESDKQEVSKLKRDIIPLQAEMKASSDRLEKNDDKMKCIRKIL